MQNSLVPALFYLDMLVEFTGSGLYCPDADLYIDPWKPVKRAVITHAHSDHARRGHGNYLAHHDSEAILRYRLGDINLQSVAYHENIRLNGVSISLHPAGHIKGSAQVRLEKNGEIWVISGDYKLQQDGISTPFEPVPCHHFVTESTFGLPVYHFPSAQEVDQQINYWIEKNSKEGFNSVIIAYALGKAQRVLKAIHQEHRVLLHSTIYNTNQAIGFDNSGFMAFTTDFKKEHLYPGVVLATPMAIGSPWLRRFEPYRLAICSGWMQLRGTRRRRNADHGFVMSDHADWEGLNQAVLATGAENIYVTHGYRSVFAKWLREKHGLNAVEIETQFEDESVEDNQAEPGSVKS